MNPISELEQAIPQVEAVVAAIQITLQWRTWDKATTDILTTELSGVKRKLADSRKMLQNHRASQCHVDNAKSLLQMIAAEMANKSD